MLIKQLFIGGYFQISIQKQGYYWWGFERREQANPYPASG
jgi:hypothetical protein